MGDVIVLAVLGTIIYLVVRSMVKNFKKGGGCAGCSCGCGTCSGSCGQKDVES